MLLKEIFAVNSEKHIRPMAGILNYHYALKD
jgi:hypothetical protein